MEEEKSTPLRENEEIVAKTEDGYLFIIKGVGAVMYRSDKEHERELRGDKFEEPAPRPQKPHALS